MIDFVLAGSKYLIIILFALFTYFSFRAQRDVPDEKKKLTIRTQRVLVFLVHAFSYLCIFINVARGNAGSVSLVKVILLYLGQLLYFVAVMCVLPSFVNLSPGFNNVMCMLINLGFIFQVRLSFDKGLKQFLFVVLATVLFVAALILSKKVKFLYRLTWVYCIVGFALVAIVFIFAKISGGAKVSITIGSISFQPFEFVKILFVLFIAAAFHKANNFKTVLATALACGAFIVGLVLCTELGTALMLAVVYILMLYVATKKFIYIGLGAGAFAAACVAAYKLFSHVRTRVDVWLNPWSDIDNKGYQITQSLFAIGTGGWLGSGLYNGEPENVPMISNDFVFSAICEELGTVFGIFLIILCLCFMLMAFRIAIRISKPFYKLTAFGLGAIYGFQVFLTIGGAIKFIPSTGVNLPFISSGGSSILASMVIAAIIQALYVLSEAAVEKERALIKDRIIKEYEADPEEEKLAEPDAVEAIRRSPAGRRNIHKGKITKINPKDIDIY